MKQLNYNNEQFEAERIVKTDTEIIGYNGDIVAFKFSGITDFSGFTLANGQEFDEREITLEQQITVNTDYLLDLDFRLMLIEFGMV